MSLQYVDYTSVSFPLPGLVARGGGNQKPGTGISEGVGKPSKKATVKKGAKKTATKKKK